MAKKNVGKLVALAAVTGAIAAGVSYFLKYKSFNKELDEEFHDFEGEIDDEEFDGTLPHEDEAAERSYVTLGEKKAETMAEEAADAAEKAAETIKETAEDAVETVADTVEELVEKAAEAVTEAADEATIEEDTVQ